MKNKKFKKYLFFLFLIILVYLIIDNFLFNYNKIEPKEKMRIVYLLVNEKTVDKNEKLSHDLFESNKYIDTIQTFETVKKYNKQYYKVKLKNINNELQKNISDYHFALNDINGNVINDLKFNEKNMEILIPSKYYESKKMMKEYRNMPVEAEFIVRTSPKKLNKINIKYKISKIFTSSKYISYNSSNYSTDITLYNYNKGKLITKNDLKIYLNDSNIPLKKDEYLYNNKTGVLSIQKEPIFINNIYVKVRKIKALSNTLNIFSINNIQEVSADNINSRIMGEFTLLDNATIDQVSKINLTKTIPYVYGKSIFYYDDEGWDNYAAICGGQLHNFNCSTLVSNYFTHAGDNLALKKAIKYGFNHSITSKQTDDASYIDGFLTDISSFFLKENDNSKKLCNNNGKCMKVTLDYDWLKLYCAHITVDAEKNNNKNGLRLDMSFSKISDKKLKVTLKSNESTAGGQDAVGYFFLKLADNPGEVGLKVQKRIYDITKDKATNLKKENIAFKLYESVNAANTGCTGYIKTAYTDANGVVTFKHLDESHNYCIMEEFNDDNESSSIKSNEYIPFNNRERIATVFAQDGIYKSTDVNNITSANIGRYITCTTPKEEAGKNLFNENCVYDNVQSGCVGFSFSKVDSMTGKYLNGSHFTATISNVKDSAGNPLDLVAPDGTSSSQVTYDVNLDNSNSWSYILTGAASGNMTLQEVSAPLGYNLNTGSYTYSLQTIPYKITRNNNNSSIPFITECSSSSSISEVKINNTPRYLYYSLFKRDKKTKKPMSNVSFSINCGGINFFAKTNENGYAAFNLGRRSDNSTNPIKCVLTEESVNGYKKLPDKVVYTKDGYFEDEMISFNMSAMSLNNIEINNINFKGNMKASTNKIIKITSANNYSNEELYRIDTDSCKLQENNFVENKKYKINEKEIEGKDVIPLTCDVYKKNSYSNFISSFNVDITPEQYENVINCYKSNNNEDDKNRCIANLNSSLSPLFENISISDYNQYLNNLQKKYEIDFLGYISKLNYDKIIENEKIDTLSFKKETESSKPTSAKFSIYKEGKGYVKVSGTSTVTLDNISKVCYNFSSYTNDVNEASSISTNSSTGEACLTNLIDDGDYIIKEVEAPGFHKLADKTTCTASPKSSWDFTTCSFKNPPTEVKIKKKINGINDLSKYSDQLNKLNFAMSGSETGGTDFEFVLKDGIYHFKKNSVDPISDGEATTNLKLNSNYEINIQHLPVGTFYIYEKDQDKCSSTDTNCKCSSLYKNPNRIKVIVSAEKNSVTNIELTNYLTEINFTKEDFYKNADGNTKVQFEEGELEVFDKIGFKIRDEDGKYLNLTKNSNSGSCSNEGSYSVYTYKGVGTTTGGTVMNTCGGSIKIKELCAGKKYYIEEVSVPDDSVFTLIKDSNGNNPYVEYNIPLDGNATTNSNNKGTISNKPTRIEINKKDITNTTNNITEPEKVATFNVYRCNNESVKCTYNNSTKQKISFVGPEKITGDQEDTNKYVYRYPNSKDTSKTKVTNLHLDSNGKILIRYLPAGKYVVVETKAPSGYFELNGSSAELEFTVKKDTLNNQADFKNVPVKIELDKKDIYKYITKEDYSDSSRINKIFDTITFKLKDKNGNYLKLIKVSAGKYRYFNSNGVATGTEENLHTKDGHLIITHLYNDQKYTIEETATDSEGYFILPKKHPTVSYDISEFTPEFNSDGTLKNSYTEEIENSPTRVVFVKRDSKTNEIINDNNNESTSDTKTTFNVYQCSKGKTSCTISSNSKLIYFENTYYNLDLTSDIDVISNPINVYKYSKTNDSTKVKDIITDRGVIVLAYLPANYTYILVETNAPDGYYQPAANDFTTFTVKKESIDDEIKYESLTSNVSNEPTRLIFKKEDLYNYYDSDDISKINSNVKLFDTMRFVLRDSEGKKLTLKCVDEDGNIKNNTNCETGYYRFLPVKENNIFEELQTLNGTFTVTHLYKNKTYYIEEIKSDDENNFILPDNFTFSEAIPFDNNGHPVVKYELPNEKPATDESITRIISNIPTRVLIEKRDSKYDYLIPDETTTFNVYQCEKSVENCTKENGTLINFEERAPIIGDKEDENYEVYKYKKLNAQGVTDLHPYLGKLILRYLPAKYKYVVVETVAPKNYMLPIGQDASIEFEIANNTTDTKAIEVPNKPTSIIIRKYSNEGELLPGAEFKIYETTEKDEEGNYTCNSNLSAKNQNKKEMKFKVIRDGVYEYRPELTDSIIKTCNDVNGVCSGIPQNPSTQLTYDTYKNTWADFANTTTSDGKTIEIQQGEALVQYLEYEHCYVIEETKAPEGYSLPKKNEDRYTMLYIEKNSSYYHDTETELINTPTPFTFYKYDEFNKLLDGAEFKLQKLNDNKKYEDIAVDLDKTLEDGTLIYKANSEGENYKITTHNGSATIYFLTAGQYRIVETKAAPGKELTKNPNIATFFVDSSGKVYGNALIVNKGKTEKIDVKPSASAKLIVNIQTGQVVIRYGLIISILTFVTAGLMIYIRKRNDK